MTQMVIHPDDAVAVLAAYSEAKHDINAAMGQGPSILMRLHGAHARLEALENVLELMGYEMFSRHPAGALPHVVHYNLRSLRTGESVFDDHH